MKTSPPAPSAIRRAGVALMMAVLPALARADEPATAAQAGARAADKTAEKLQHYKATHSELSKTEVKEAFEQIDAELNHLDQLAEAAPTTEEKAEVRTRYDILKTRRNELKQGFTRARFDEFKAELHAEVNRVSEWAREKFARRTATPSAASATDSTAAAERTSPSQPDPTGMKTPAVKAALSRLDADCEMLSVRIDALNDPAKKAESKRRLESYQARRAELNNAFRQEDYEALARDVKAEWNHLIH